MLRDMKQHNPEDDIFFVVNKVDESDGKKQPNLVPPQLLTEHRACHR